MNSLEALTLYNRDDNGDCGSERAIGGGCTDTHTILYGHIKLARIRGLPHS
jgi:hypothetical protein